MPLSELPELPALLFVLPPGLLSGFWVESPAESPPDGLSESPPTVTSAVTCATSGRSGVPKAALTSWTASSPAVRVAWAGLPSRVVS